MNKNIAKSLLMIGVTLAMVTGATTALFSDTETSTGNTFSAGTIDISVDGENPWNATAEYNLEDLKPCETEYIEFTIRNVGTNPVVLRKRINVTNEETGTQSEPECDAETWGGWDGANCTGTAVNENNAISQVIHYAMDLTDASGTTTLIPEDWGVMVSDIDSLWIPLGTLDVGEELTVKQSYHLDKNAGNEYQGDKMTFNIDLYGEQRMGVGQNTTGGVVLENKTGDPDWYTVIDETWGLLTWDGSGNYTFKGFGLDTSVSYRLVYWNGTNEIPIAGGAYTAPNGDGTLSLSGTYTGFNTNTNAKYWLRPDDWDNAKTLWEGNLVN